MKKLLIILIILISINSQAQTFNPSQLIGTKWQRVERFSDPTIKWEFSKEDISETVNRKNINKTVSHTRKYYFSPTAPIKFDWNKVGKCDSGKYLVYYNDISKRMSYLKIESVSNDTLKFWHEANPDAIGDVSRYVLYKRIK
jgi:hypothetical protein